VASGLKELSLRVSLCDFHFLKAFDEWLHENRVLPPDISVLMYGAHILLRARNSGTMDIMIDEYCKLIRQWVSADHLVSVAEMGNVELIVKHIRSAFGYTGTFWCGSVGDQAGFGGWLGLLTDECSILSSLTPSSSSISPHLPIKFMILKQRLHVQKGAFRLRTTSYLMAIKTTALLCWSS